MNVVWKEDYTIEDIYALPEGKRAESVDGRLQRFLSKKKNVQYIYKVEK